MDLNKEAMENLSNNKGEEEIPNSVYEAGKIIKESIEKDDE